MSMLISLIHKYGGQPYWIIKDIRSLLDISFMKRIMDNYLFYYKNERRHRIGYIFGLFYHIHCLNH